MKLLIPALALSFSLVAFAAPTKEITCDIGIEGVESLKFELKSASKTDVTLIPTPDVIADSGWTSIELPSETLTRGSVRNVGVGFFMGELEFVFTADILDNSNVGTEFQVNMSSGVEGDTDSGLVTCKATK